MEYELDYDRYIYSQYCDKCCEKYISQKFFQAIINTRLFMSSVPLGGLGRFLSHFGNLTHSKDLSKPYSLFDLEAKTKGKNVCFLKSANMSM